jgi:hypothetical protein
MIQLHIYPENISIYLSTEYVYLWELQTQTCGHTCISKQFNQYYSQFSTHCGQGFLACKTPVQQ